MVSVLVISLGLLFITIGAGVIATNYLKLIQLHEFPEAGLVLLKVGLILQLVGLTALISLALLFLFVSHHWVGSPPPPAVHVKTEWRRLGWVVTIAIILVTVNY